VQCPKCGGDTYVISTDKIGEVVERIRRCSKCHHYFETEEKIFRERKWSENHRKNEKAEILTLFDQKR